MKNSAELNQKDNNVSSSFLKNVDLIWLRFTQSIQLDVSVIAVISTLMGGKECIFAVVMDSQRIITQRNMLEWHLYVYCSRRSVAWIAKAFSMLTVIVAILYVMRIWIRTNVVVLIQTLLDFWVEFTRAKNRRMMAPIARLRPCSTTHTGQSL